MIYFKTSIGHPRVKHETTPDKSRVSKPKNCGSEIEPKPEPIGPKIPGASTQNWLTAISNTRGPSTH
jgi:hypothetical protein